MRRYQLQVGVIGDETASWPPHLEPLSDETRFSLLFNGAAGERALVTMEAKNAKERLAVVCVSLCCLSYVVFGTSHIFFFPSLL